MKADQITPDCFRKQNFLIKTEHYLTTMILKHFHKNLQEF